MLITKMQVTTVLLFGTILGQQSVRVTRSIYRSSREEFYVRKDDDEISSALLRGADVSGTRETENRSTTFPAAGAGRGGSYGCDGRNAIESTVRYDEDKRVGQTAETEKPRRRPAGATGGERDGRHQGARGKAMDRTVGGERVEKFEEG